MLRIAVTWLLLQILQGFRPDLALDFRVDEILLDVFVMPSLANHFMLDSESPNCTEIPASPGQGRSQREKGVTSSATP